MVDIWIASLALAMTAGLAQRSHAMYRRSLRAGLKKKLSDFSQL
jgi:hypothetical protein